MFQVRQHLDLYPHALREIEHFFSIYKELEKKKIEVKGWQDCDFARRIIQESHARFNELRKAA
jgi:inorganic pyrophosphatase